MKNALKKQGKKINKPMNINISLNISSKNINNNDIIENINQVHPIPNHNHVVLKNHIQHKLDHQSTINKSYHQRVVRSNRNSIELPDLISGGMKKKKLSTTSETFTHKKKNNQHHLQIPKNHHVEVTTNKKKKNKQMLLKRLNQCHIDSIFQQYRKGKITLTHMKSLVQGILIKEKTNNYLRHFHKLSDVEKNSKDINAQSIDKMRKRACMSQRGHIHLKKSVNNSYHNYSLLSNGNFVNQIVNNKFIDSSCVLDNDDQPDDLANYLNLKNRQEQKIKLIVKTSKSVKQFQSFLQAQRKLATNQPLIKQQTRQNQMAIRIQTAWRQYQTRKIIKHIINNTDNKVNIEPQITDHHQQLPKQQYQHEVINRISTIMDHLKSNNVQNKTPLSYNFNQQIWTKVTSYIKSNLFNPEVSKDQCLNNIINYIQQIKNSSYQQEPHQLNYQQQSEQINSFTNKFESKQVGINHQIQISENSEINTFQEGSITLFAIEEALRTRKKILNKQKDKQITNLIHRKQNGKVNENTYRQQKQKIEKWFKSCLSELKKVSKNLQNGYQEAKNIINNCQILNQSSLAQDNKKKRMIKCLSENYLKNRYNSLIRNQNLQIENLINLNQQPKIQTTLNQEVILNPIKLDYLQFSKQFDDISETDNFLRMNQIQQQSKEIKLFDNFFNDKNKKLKLLSLEDKDDIYQFIFIDLCIELFCQCPQKQRIIKNVKKHIDLTNRLNKIPRGVKTNLTFVKQYLQNFQKYILNYHRGTLKRIQEPMGPNASQILKYMRQFPIQNDQCSQTTSGSIIPSSVFEQFQQKQQNQLKLPKLYEQQIKQKNRLNFLNKLFNLHNKAIFDCLNENLDNLRPYGILGKPFPWKKYIQLKLNYTKQQLKMKLNEGVQNTIENCTYLCGILVDKQQSIFMNHKVSQNYVNQIRQDRISKMLATDLIQNQIRWTFYDDQQTELRIQLSRLVFSFLINETIIQMERLQKFHK